MKGVVYIFLALSFFSCSTKTETFPELQNVSNLENTDFVPTLESPFSIKNNTIYGATLPFAWNEIRNSLNQPLFNFESTQLLALHSTKSFINTLTKGEYETSVQVDGNVIKASAYFRKSLPFKTELTKFNDPIDFNGNEVESFGFCGYNEIARINYFHNESNLSISLFPENSEHEIILIMDSNMDLDSVSFINQFNKFQQLLKAESTHETVLNDNDKVQIPIIQFHLEKAFSDIIESTFQSKTMKYTVSEAYQRNAFILNEKGAEVESEAVFAVEETSAPSSSPKRMIFNKPFFIFLKRKDAPHPYFGVFVANTELLTILK